MTYASPVIAPVSSVQPKTVLVVDDEPPILALVRDVLEDEGYMVLTASSAADGLEIARNKDIALVLTDLMMPQMDGIAFSSALRDQPYTTEVPIILMSAAMPAQLDVCFDGFVAKPFSIEQLINEVNTHALLINSAAA